MVKYAKGFVFIGIIGNIILRIDHKFYRKCKKLYDRSWILLTTSCNAILQSLRKRLGILTILGAVDVSVVTQYTIKLNRYIKLKSTKEYLK